MPSLQEQEMCEAVELLGVTLYEGAGCEACDQIGYKGRIGIFELMCITDGLRARIVKESVVETSACRWNVCAIARRSSEG